MSLVGQLKSRSANRLGRSDRSAVGRWFWEIAFSSSSSRF